ncbi:probable Bax inhibitor 1 [Paramacrobiotus metropolitanus]|uniref:probable Bax inhibitor 1 n=1 Tax=Paramacrobiotus metropolitanus TaxID=2943436 RepID=UPI002445DB1E|nr:probable Bax inhibitor 1 [Paramacrobiotus metropolitanus]
MDFMRNPTSPERSRFSMEGLLDFSALEKPVKAHLTRVYGALSMACLVCTAGVYCTLQGIIPAFLAGNFLFILAIFGMTIALVTMEPTMQNQDKRMGLFMGIAAMMGINMTPLIQTVIQINPQIIFTALLMTATIFVCFTLASLLSGNARSFLYLGGILMSGLSSLMIIRLIGMLTGWRMAMDVTLYLGLALMCGFILFDTQMIVMKRRMGDTDYIKHALDLFIDAVSLFKHILVLLAQKDEQRNRKRRSN